MKNKGHTRFRRLENIGQCIIFLLYEGDEQSILEEGFQLPPSRSQWPRGMPILCIGHCPVLKYFSSSGERFGHE